MKIAYLDCSSGISGDMTLSALVDAGVPFNQLIALLRKVAHPYKISLVKHKVTRCGLGGTKIDIRGGEQHCQVDAIYKHLRHSQLSPDILSDSLKVFDLLVKTETKVHRHKLSQAVRLHELGSVDTLIDIAGSVWGMHYLNIKDLFVSKLPLTEGKIKTQHGLYPLPAPATLEILKGFELFKSDVPAELITPTGAALISALAKPSWQLPLFSVSNIGYGAGTWDLPQQPNILRFIIGESNTRDGLEYDKVCILESNIDNVSGEIIGYLFDRLFKAGALDVTTLPIQMKKNRPGVLLKVICPIDLTVKMEQTIFEEIPTLGIRKYFASRAKLKRRTDIAKTKYGAIRLKLSYSGKKLINIAPEYEDCRKAAEKFNVPLKSVMAEASNHKT